MFPPPSPLFPPTSFTGAGAWPRRARLASSKARSRAHPPSASVGLHRESFGGSWTRFLFLTKFRHHNSLNVSVKGDCEMCGDGCLHDNCPKSFPGLKVSFLYLTLFLSVLGPVPSWICLEFSFFVLTVWFYVQYCTLCIFTTSTFVVVPIKAEIIHFIGFVVSSKHS